MAQRREIVEGLVADLENARHTDRVVRYRAGLSALPPPPSPPGWRVAEAATAQAEDLVPEAPVEASPDEAEPAEPPRPAETVRVDETLDEFVTELVEDDQSSELDDEVGADATTGATQDDAEATEPSPSPGRDRPWREPRTVVGWWEQWFGSETDEDEPRQQSEPDAEDPEAVSAPATGSGADDQTGTIHAGGSLPEASDGANAVSARPTTTGPAAGSDDPVTMPGAEEAPGAPAKLVPSPGWPTAPAPPPAPRKPVVVLVQPIPEPSVPIDVEGGLLAVPVALEASGRGPDGSGMQVVQAGR